MARTNRSAAPSDWRHVAGAGALVLAVFGTLILGAVLRVDRDGGARIEPEVAQPLAEPPAAVPANVSPDELTLGIPFADDVDLADRAADDERRLHASGAGYTLQFAVVCQPENARATLEALDRTPDLYVLTTVLDDQVCFRLCWGFYDSERQARAVRDLPPVLVAITDRPRVLSAAEALP